MKKENIYLDMSKLTEKQQKKVISLLPWAISSYQYEIINEYDYFHLLFSEIDKIWIIVNSRCNKTEITYKEFKKLMKKENKETNTMKVKIKKLHKDAVTPQYAKQGDAGLDLTAVSKEYDENDNVVYGTGLSFEIPEGFVGLLFPRSSNAKKDLLLSNSVGVLDSGYRGEVLFKFKSSESIWDWDKKKDSNAYYTCEDEHFDNSIKLQHYEIGDRIGQLIILPYPKIEFEEVEELSETERGCGGYGHSGN